MPTLTNIFTDKAVGIAFAAAFALWAWMLNGMKDSVVEGQIDIQKDIAQMRAEITQHQIYAAQASAEFREQIKSIDRRVIVIEQDHRILEKELNHGGGR